MQRQTVGANADIGFLSSETCRGFQIYSNLLYIAAGALGVAVGTAPPLDLAPRGRVAARTTITLVGGILVVTGLVSTWYHRVGTDGGCSHDTYHRVGSVDIGCAATSSAAGLAVLLPLTIVGLARRPRAGPAVLLVVAAGMGLAAVCLHLNLSKNETRATRPCVYDVGHGMWHTLGAMSAALAFCATFLALQPGPPRRLTRGRSSAAAARG
jgi:hypothetical protein